MVIQLILGFNCTKDNLPVQEIESTPSPKYSTMAPVPPLTVRMPATFKITSLGEVQSCSFPVSLTPITWNANQKEILKKHLWKK